MKRIIFAAFAATTLLASCSKVDLQDSQPADEYTTVTCGFTTDDPATRAFFDNNATPEAWETEVKTATIYGYSGSGHLVLQHEMTSTEIAAQKVTLRVLKVPYNFYIVANYTITDWVRGLDKLQTISESKLADYNGTMAQIGSACKRPEGFVMTGQMLNVDPATMPNFLLSLKRSVAKIALRVNVATVIDPANPNGRLRLDNARLTGYSQVTCLYRDYTDIRTSSYMNQLPLQKGRTFDNLFYVYFNPATTPDKCAKITLTGIFDPDGNFTTADDLQAVTYTLTLNPEGDGALRRNGYYRIEANIKQLP